MLNVDFVEDCRIVGIDGFELRFEWLSSFATISYSDQATYGSSKLIPNDDCIGFRIRFPNQRFAIGFGKFQNSPDGSRM